MFLNYRLVNFLTCSGSYRYIKLDCKRDYMSFSVTYSIFKPNKMQGWHYNKAHFLLANISASTASLLQGQCCAEKYVMVLKFHFMFVFKFFVLIVLLLLLLLLFLIYLFYYFFFLPLCYFDIFWTFLCMYFLKLLLFLSMFPNVPECSGIFRNVPCSCLYRRQ